jgi:hypothetical protein
MGDLINDLFDHFSDLFFDPLLGNGMYARGFLFGLAVALAIGWLTRKLYFHMGRMQKFFKTIPPSLNPSPSGFSSMNSCLSSAVKVGIIIFVLIFFGAGFLHACNTP